MRLLGLTSKGFVSMVIIQSIMFVVPSILIAYICACPSLYFIYNWAFGGDLSQLGISVIPSWQATLEAVAIGILIPLLSAIIPIKRALSKSLSDSLNTARASLSGAIVVIEGRSTRMVPFILFGALCVIAGITVYIVLPMALLAENASIILQVFFLILIGMILGLALLAANLRSFVEIIVSYCLLFWEKKSMRSLVKKNLIAHKRTNKLTSIIYALTLGCVIFLCVALNLVLRTAQTADSSQSADIVLISSNKNGFDPKNTDRVL